MTKAQLLRIHARLARIHEAVDPVEGVKIRSYVALAMRQVDERVAEIEKEA